jgi:malonate transporter MadL subunit
MKIYGVGLLAACFLIGHFIGDYFGKIFHLNGNLGGVGFAMLILVIGNDYFKQKNMMPQETEQGILFWSTMYIPVVVAMSASQNVKAALSGGWLAILVGIIATSFCYLLIPILNNYANKITHKK